MSNVSQTVSKTHTQTLEAEKIELWKRTFCKDATNDELELFLSVCNRTGLSPEARQIYLVGRWDSKSNRNVMTPQTSIDGFRLIAERSGHYAGQLGPFYTDDGKWSDVWFKKTPPRAAKIGVLRHDFKEPLWCVAHWDSYAQKDKSNRPTFMWNKMPEVMLDKCAESLALRKAFPNEMSGLYTEEEMSQATVIDVTTEAKNVDTNPQQAIIDSTVAKNPELYDMNNIEHKQWLWKLVQTFDPKVSAEECKEFSAEIHGMSFEEADVKTQQKFIDQSEF